MNFIKTTMIGGILFMLPLFIIILIVGKAFELMLMVVEPIDKLIPAHLFYDVPFSNLLALLIILILCFTTGMIARSPWAKRFYRSIDNGLLVIPGYAFIKAYSDSVRADDAEAKNILPVLVRLDDYSQIGFEIERLDNEQVVIYLPGAPDPWSGSVCFFTADRVKPLDLSVPEAMNYIRRLGRGSRVFQKEI